MTQQGVPRRGLLVAGGALGLLVVGMLIGSAGDGERTVQSTVTRTVTQTVQAAPITVTSVVEPAPVTMTQAASPPVGFLDPAPVPAVPAEPSVPATVALAPPVPESAAYYGSCSQARAAGAAPLYAGQPGYRSGLDRDGDGVACES